LIVFLALPAAAAALAIPGKVGETAGIASILALAGLASIAGHRWGMVVILAASAALTADVLPVVINTSTSGNGMFFAGIALVCALPAIAALVSATPNLVSELAGGIAGIRVRRFAGNVAVAAVALWMLVPTLIATQVVLEPSASANPPVQLSVMAPDSSTTGSATPAIATSTPAATPVSPISLRVTERSDMTRRTSGAFAVE
jgi:hypothetical protein